MNRHPRHGFTLSQLVLMLAILLVLLALLLPTIAKARALAARNQSQNNIRRMVIALHNHNDTYNVLPPGVDDNHFSAASKLLPFIDQKNAYKLIDFKKDIDDKANAQARGLLFKIFISPRDPLLWVKTESGSTNYLFNDRVFFLNSKMTIGKIAKADGASVTVAIGETLKGDGQTQAMNVWRQYVLLKKEDLKATGPNSGVKYFKDNKHIASDRCASWMDGRFLQGTFNGRLRPNDERPDVSCGGLSGVSALRSFDPYVLVGMCDGSVRTVNTTVSHKTWEAAMTPAGGEVMGSDW